MPMEEWLLNWNNNVYQDRDARMKKAAATFDSFLTQGYSASDSAEMLVASGVADKDLALQILDSRLQMARGARRETKPVLPKRYADVKDKVEEIIFRLPAEETLSLLSGGLGKDRFTSMAVANLSQKDAKDMDELLRMARSARGQDPRIVEAIHTLLEPYIQNSIIDTELLAKDAQQNKTMKLAFAADGKTATAEDEHGRYRVDLEHKTCTCSRYLLGGFKHLGLACEHIVEAMREAAGEDWTELSGTKKVFAQKADDGRRVAWCGRASREIDVTASCVEAECPFFSGDKGDYVCCAFATR